MRTSCLPALIVFVVTFTLSAQSATPEAQAIRAVLVAAIAAGGSTLKDYARPDGELGYFAHQFRVYGREGEPCVVCGTPIKKILVAQRGTHYCPKCQRR